MGANIAKLVVDGWVQEGRGKRPDRRFDEAKKDEDSLYPETMKSYLRMRYEGIWNQKLAPDQEEEVKPEENLKENQEEKHEENQEEKHEENLEANQEGKPE